jgi:hypothetical protein
MTKDDVTAALQTIGINNYNATEITYNEQFWD